MNASFSPPVLMLLAAVLAGFVRGRLIQWIAIVAPLLSMVFLMAADDGSYGAYTAFGHDLHLIHIDWTSRLFAIIFLAASALGHVFAFTTFDRKQTVAALAYAGSAVGAVLAGDLLTLFIFWEVVAFSPVLLITSRGTPQSARAGFRYLMIQLFSGLFVLAGVVIRMHGGAGLEVSAMSLGEPGALLIFIGFGIKCGWPLLHGWIVDGYPASTVGGCVFLGVFTTKLAVYALVRCFPGTEFLVGMGAVMAVLPLLWGLVEDDMRRVVCYAMMNQLGIMMVGVGLGTTLSTQGVVTHAFCHILYDSVLFMAAGAIMHRMGTTSIRRLSGLRKTMPWTSLFWVVGALSISSLPLLNGFISKSMIVSAAGKEQQGFAWVMLLIATAGVFLVVGLRVTVLAFMGRPDEKQLPKRAPTSMRIAMGIAAAACLLIGLFPGLLYGRLPVDPADLHFHAWTVAHVVTQLELMAFTAAAFVLCFRLGLIPRRSPAVLLDVDWVYRRLGRAFLRFDHGPVQRLCEGWARLVNERIPAAFAYFAKNPAGAMKLGIDRLRLAALGLVGSPQQLETAQTRLIADRRRYREHEAVRAWPIGTTVLYMTLAFAIYLILYLIRL